jgi:hypothetical protein
MAGVVEQPVQPAKLRAFGRSRSDCGRLSQAEEKLIQKVRLGEPADFGKTLPATPAERQARTVRAKLVRFLALGGDDATPVHEKGVRIEGAVIDGSLDLEDCTLVGDLSLQNCELTGALNLRGSKTFAIRLSGTKCGSIAADGAKVTGSMSLNESFRSSAVVHLAGTTISGNLECERGIFEGSDAEGDGLICDGIDVGGDFVLRDVNMSNGALRLSGSKIGGDLDCENGSFQGSNSYRHAINCEGANIGGHVFLRQASVTKGVLWFVGAKVGHDFNCRGGSFYGIDANGNAIVCDRADIKGTANFGLGFAAAGTVRLAGATIGTDVACNGGQFCVKPSQPTAPVQPPPAPQQTPRSRFADICLTLDRATVAGTLWLTSGSQYGTFYRGISLAGAQIDSIVDSANGGTRSRQTNSATRGDINPTFLRLDGLTYSHFGEPTILSGDARKAFLRLQPNADLTDHFKPQPWAQMIKVLRETGHVGAAREVAIAFEEQRRKAGQVAPIARPLHAVYGVLIGYGQRPMRLVGLLMATWLLCGAFFWFVAEEGWFAPTQIGYVQNDAYKACRPQNHGNWVKCGAPEYTQFNALTYSLDLLLPLVGLQQDSSWTPIADKGTGTSSTGYVTLGSVARVVMWFEILFGWAGSLLLASVLSGLAKRVE